MVEAFICCISKIQWISHSPFIFKDLANFCKLDGATDKESCMFLNLIFQFLWREWRDSPKTRNFFIRKMNMEFQEMLLHKAAGKIMEQITVRDYYLGDSLPEFKSKEIFSFSCFLYYCFSPQKISNPSILLKCFIHLLKSWSLSRCNYYENW